MTFLTKIVHKYRNAPKILIILDNASWHHAKKVKNLFKKDDRLELMFLPPYSPDLNVIERLWRYVRQNVTHNTFFRSFKEFGHALRSFFDSLENKSAELISLCKLHSLT